MPVTPSAIDEAIKPNGLIEVTIVAFATVAKEAILAANAVFFNVLMKRAIFLPSFVRLTTKISD
ncbi:hypothetical protein [Pasteurella multocida]|uniref:hypothetical protein n=1 Tax=Pasteurella multocida TaxID=747 RepID=UPI00117F91A0|nr:hypothetical protein [Pasteurella multocida]